MKKNIGSIDRVVRILLAVVFAVLYFTGTVTGLVGIILLVLGVIFLATSAMSFCPIYWATGLTTKKADNPKA